MDFSETIFVTGGAGFIGSNFLNRVVLKYPNYFFVNVDCLTYAANLDNIRVSQCKNYVFEKVDIRSYPALEQLFVRHVPTGVINFAAESHVDVSIKDPNIFIETNIQGTHNLLALSQKYNVKRFHQISTDEVYGALTHDAAGFKETDALLPNNPYSATKASADLMTRAYNRTFGLDTVITRCSNNYGPHQDITKLIPKFITRLVAGKRVPLYSKGEQMREWLFVDDHVDAIDMVYRHGASGEIYNIGGGTEHTNIDLVRKLLNVLGKDETSIEYVPDRLGHDFRYALNIEKIEKLGWKPKVTFDEGLRRTLEFYKRNLVL